MNNQRRELVCCERCGRDTRSRDGICARCRGIEHPHASREYKGRESRPVPDDLGELEDDYSEESGPDDVHGGIGHERQ